MTSKSSAVSAQPIARPETPRGDVIALVGGIIFSLLFTALIAWLGARLDSVPLGPDQGAEWYYWKLPNPTFWTHATAWGLYAAHQVTLWGIIWYAQTRVKKYSDGLGRINVIALAANAFFIVVHLAQTHIWYDGLAQDVSIFSSQGSVILMLVWILLMENSRRGLFFGKRVPFSQAIITFARKYHGYVFSWAAIYTFWYHPMVNTPGHLVGFFYMFMLLLQGSLFLTRVHINRWWTLTQEVIVLVHAALVALMQGNGAWPMFAFGFAGLLVITQMHGLGLGRIPKWIIAGIFVASALWLYNGRWLALNEVIRIPAIEYVSVFVLAGLLWVGLWVARWVRDRFARQPA